MADVESQEKVPLSSGNERPYSPNITSQDDTRTSCNFIGVHMHTVVHYLFLAFLAVIIILMAVCIVVLVFKTDNATSRPPRKPMILHSEREQQPKADTWTTQNKHHKKHKLEVVSYMGYQTKMLEVPDDTLIDLYVSIASKNDWPQTAPMYNSETVSMLHLEGLFDLNIVYFLLQNLSHLSVLHINNTDDENCEARQYFQESKFSSNFTKTRVNRLKELTFENFSKCTYFIKSFPDLIESKGLTSFRIDHGRIDSDNLLGVRSIIQSSSKTLKKLCFPMTTWDVVLFDTTFKKIPNLSKLRLDFLSDRKDSPHIIAAVNAIFPNIEHFISLHGHATFKDLQNILGSTSIKKLQTGITVPEHYEEFKEFFLVNDFPSLNFVELNIRFDKISTTMPCKMEAVEDLKKSFREIEIHYECEVQTQSPYFARLRSARFR